MLIQDRTGPWRGTSGFEHVVRQQTWKAGGSGQGSDSGGYKKDGERKARRKGRDQSRRRGGGNVLNAKQQREQVRAVNRVLRQGRGLRAGRATKEEKGSERRTKGEGAWPWAPQGVRGLVPLLSSSEAVGPEGAADLAVSPQASRGTGLSAAAGHGRAHGRSGLTPVTCTSASRGREGLCLRQLLPASSRKPSWPAPLCAVRTRPCLCVGLRLRVRVASFTDAVGHGGQGLRGSGVAGAQRRLHQPDAGRSSCGTSGLGTLSARDGASPKPLSPLTVGGWSRRRVLGHLTRPHPPSRRVSGSLGAGTQPPPLGLGLAASAEQSRPLGRTAVASRLANTGPGVA